MNVSQSVPVRLLRMILSLCLIIFILLVTGLGLFAPNRLQINRSHSLPFIFAWKEDHDPGRNDVVIFVTNSDQAPWPAGTKFGKRIVGIAGDHVRCTMQQCEVNGHPVIHNPPHPLRPLLLREWTLSPTEVFVVGDDLNSFDSRYYGPIERHRIEGVIRILW